MPGINPKFAALLQKNETDVEEIPLHPVGHFRGFVEKIVFGTFKSERDGGAEVPTCEFHLRAREPLGDVDADAWQAFTEHSSSKRVQLRQRSFIEEDNLRRFYDFMIEKFGAPRGLNGEAMLEHCMGAECAFEVVHKTAQKSGKPFADIGRVLNVGEATS